MDDALFHFLPVAHWQWVNLFTTFIGGMLCAWLCFHRLDPDDFAGNMQFAVLSLRATVALTGCALGIVSIASIEALAGIGPYHMPSEVLLNVFFTLMMIAVTAFHVRRRRLG